MARVKAGGCFAIAEKLAEDMKAEYMSVWEYELVGEYLVEIL